MIPNLIPQVLAATTDTSTTVDIDKYATAGNFFGYTCVAQLVKNLASMGLIVAGMAFFVFLVLGGIDYITAGGDKVKTENAMKKISSALIGLAIVASSWAIFLLVKTFFGINLDNICSDNPLNTSIPGVGGGGSTPKK